MNGHRAVITIVFFLLIVTIVLQILSLTKDTWWKCDVTIEAPIMNITKGSKHDIAVSIKMRTSLDETCWYVKREERSSVPEKFFMPSSPIKACLTKKLYKKHIPVHSDKIEDSKKMFSQTKMCIIFALVFVILALIFQFVNICLCNGCLVATNICLSIFGAISTLVGVIIFAKNVGYKEKYNQYDMVLIPILIRDDPSLTAAGRNLLKVLFDKLTKEPSVLGEKYSTGEAFVLFWCSLAVLLLSILISSIMHVCGLRSKESSYTQAPSRGNFKMPKFHWPSWPSLPSWPSMPSLPSWPSLPSVGGGGGGFSFDLGGDD